MVGVGALAYDVDRAVAVDDRRGLDRLPATEHVLPVEAAVGMQCPQHALLVAEIDRAVRPNHRSGTRSEAAEVRHRRGLTAGAVETSANPELAASPWA